VNCGYALASRTSLTLLSMATAAAVDFILNVILIPHYGAWGAAIAGLIGFGAGFVISVIKMGRVFPFPLPDAVIIGAGLIGVAVMAAFLAPFYRVTALTSALYVIPAAIAIYFGCVFLFLHFAGRNPFNLMRGLWSAERSSAGF
jgi:O-antigen/teichoic acid export membrane protein